MEVLIIILASLVAVGFMVVLGSLGQIRNTLTSIQILLERIEKK